MCYEIFVRSFYDSDGDGIGDLRGVTEKLSYINDGDPASHRDLGASCIWLMPIAQSPSYHGYDVTNYYEVNRDYGTTADFKALVAEAHRRGISILVDMVLNHSSSEHPWFQSALSVPGSPYRDWYRWSASARRVPGWGGEVWHRSPVRDEYYYGLFWSGMPDLNLGNPAVQEETRKIARYWIQEMGADGFRFDAVNHFFETDESVRNAPAVHPWLRDYSAYIHQLAPGSFTVGELWDSTSVLRSFYPDQLDTYYNKELSDALVDAVRTGSSRLLIAALQDTQRDLPAGRYSLWLRNHDQDRTMTEFGGNVAKAKLAATLLLTLPGIPFIYYGEEIGMTGAKPDPRVRTPMQWTARGDGFTRGQPWEPMQPDSFAVTVEAQDGDSTSLLSLYRRMIRLRASRPELGAAAECIVVNTGSDSVLAFVRRAEGRSTLVVANLSGSRTAALTLSSPAAGFRRRALRALEPFEVLIL